MWVKYFSLAVLNPVSDCPKVLADFCDPLCLLGYLIIAGIALASPLAALAAVMGSIEGVVVALAFGGAKDRVELGLYSYNAVLAFLCGVIFLKPSRISVFIAFLAGLTATLFYSAWSSVLAPIGLPPLTFPAAAISVVYMIFCGEVLRDKVVPLNEVAVPEIMLLRAIDSNSTVPSDGDVGSTNDNNITTLNGINGL